MAQWPVQTCLSDFVGYSSLMKKKQKKIERCLAPRLQYHIINFHNETAFRYSTSLHYLSRH